MVRLDPPHIALRVMSSCACTMSVKQHLGNCCMADSAFMYATSSGLRYCYPGAFVRTFAQPGVCQMFSHTSSDQSQLKPFMNAITLESKRDP